MDQITPETIGSLLLIGIALAIGIGGFFSWCKRVDGRPAYDPLRDGPEDPQDVSAGRLELEPELHLATLRRPLSPARNMTGAAQAHRYAGATETEGGAI